MRLNTADVRTYAHTFEDPIKAIKDLCDALDVAYQAIDRVEELCQISQDMQLGAITVGEIRAALEGV